MRWIIRSLLSLILLTALAVGLLFLIPTEKIAGLATGKFKALTGRDLVIEGAIRPSVWPVLGVKTGPVSVSNASWSDEGPMFRAEGLSIAVDISALIAGEARITEIEALGPQILLERAEDGRENWVFGGENGGNVTKETPGVGKAFTLAKGSMSAGRVVFIDHKTGNRFEVTEMVAETAIPDFEGKVRLLLSAAIHDQAFDLDLTVGAFRPFLDGDVVPVEAVIAAGAARVDFMGRAGWRPLMAEGQLDADLKDLTDIAALVGQTPPALPQGLGADGIKVKGALTLTESGSVHLRGGSLRLDETALALDADLVPGADRPKLSAKVVAGALDLRGLTGGAGGGEAGGVAAEGWPRDRIDASGLGALDASIALTADAVDLGLARLGATQAKLTIERARAVFDMRQIAAYDGSLTGQFVINGRNGLSVGGDIRLAGIALQPFFRDVAGYERLIGTGDLALKFLGVGGTLDEIMQGLEGSGQIALGQGEILGLDIAGMILSLDPGHVGEGQKTIFDSLRASFTIAGGVLENDDLVMDSPLVALKGAGKIGIGARNLNYRLRATALADAEGAGGLTAPLLIRGSWADPKFRLDLEALAEEQLAEEKAALEAKAKEKAAALEAEAKEKLKEELGVVQQEGESLEDAVKRRGEEVLTDEAAEALKKLLGGN